MNNPTSFGEYFRLFITAVPADLQSEEARQFAKTILKFPEEGVYIYSFIKGRMLYADGWEEVLGYKNEEINMFTVVEATCPEFLPFSNELNDKTLQFVQSKTTDLEKYSYSIETKKIHKNGQVVPMILRVGVFRSEQGKVTEIIGRCQVNRNLKFGKVMQYAVYGPDVADFERELNKSLFRHIAISEKEKEALSFVAKGYSFKEIANHFNVSPSAIEKRIIPMYKRFDVRSLTHLVSFAYDNHILP